MKRVFVTLVISTLAGCIHYNQQESYIAKNSPSLLAVPFIEQKPNECGPTALAMLMGFLDSQTNQSQLLEDLRIQTLTPKRAGAFPQDIITAARRQGYETKNVNTFNQIDQSLKAQMPVMLLLDVSWHFIPQWHYVVVVGHGNGSTKSYVLHSDQDAFLEVSKSAIAAQWVHSKNWGINIRR